MPPEEALERAETEYETLPGQKVAPLLERPVAVGAPRGQIGIRVALDAVGLAIIAQGLRPRITSLALTPSTG